jgi:predicted nucleotidyltransferase
MSLQVRLNTLLKNSGKLKILRYLYFNNDVFTGRGIAEAIGMSASATHRTLKTLHEENVITARKKGRAILYSLNRELHIIKTVLAPLFDKEKKVLSDLLAYIKKTICKYKQGLVSIVLFGSVARGEDTAKSDIDILIVVENQQDKKKIDSFIDNMCITIAKNYGTTLSPYIVTRAEIKDNNPKKKRLISSILQNNRLLYGEPIERVVA